MPDCRGAIEQPIVASARLLGVRVDDVAIPTLLERIMQAVALRDRLVVVNANAHLVMLARKRAWLRIFFDRAVVAFCDGAGVQLAIALLTGKRFRRHTPPQWIDELARRLADVDASIFWLGGRADVLAKAALLLEQRTGLATVGKQHGFFDMTRGSADNEAVIAAINRARPAVLLLTMGMPVQEQWLAENWDRLDVRVAITAGALVDHVAGEVRRPPMWVANAGLEWAVRLAAEPRRLWRRYVLGLPHFGALVMLQMGHQLAGRLR